MHDPSLTPLGEEQCRELAENFPYHASVELLVSSPLRRAVQTALLSFEPEVERGMRIITIPEAQETGSRPADTGTNKDVLEKEFEGQPIDFGLLVEGWNSNTGKWSPVPDAIRERAKEVRKWIKSRPEKEVVLVTHGAFLHFLTEDWTGCKRSKGINVRSLLQITTFSR
jgi:broad specificity phosphatase PhoE